MRKYRAVLNLCLLLAGTGISSSSAQAQLTLTLSNYTTDELSFTIAGTFTADSIGTAPGYLSIKNDWSNNQGINTDLFSSAPTSVAGTMTIGGVSAQTIVASSGETWGDAVYWTNPSGSTNTAFTAGTAVSGSITLMGIGQFDPITNNNLQLVSGFTQSPDDWARFEANATAVPEPSTYALLIGTACLGFVVWKRRRQTKELRD